MLCFPDFTENSIIKQHKNIALAPLEVYQLPQKQRQRQLDSESKLISTLMLFSLVHTLCMKVVGQQGSSKATFKGENPVYV